MREQPSQEPASTVGETQIAAPALDGNIVQTLAGSSEAAATLAGPVSHRRAEPLTFAADAYAVGAELAHGGMGRVLQAEDRKLGRVVAMKVMKLEAAASPSARSRFIREATVLARLEHPNIVPIHDLGMDSENCLFYTMKLVQGRTLAAILNGLKQGDPEFAPHYTLDRLLTIFRKICDAMSLAHARGVIHRDLKPDNVMVGEFGEVLVMDWGLAKVTGDMRQAIEESARRADATQSGSGDQFRQLADAELQTAISLTMDGAVMGTPYFMSPEQAHGNLAQIDQQSDVFSLGAILYAILTLHPPVEGESAAEIIERIKQGQILPPTAYNVVSTVAGGTGAAKSGAADARKSHPLSHCPGGKVPAALSAVTMRALAVDKSRRYATVAEFAVDIEAYQGGFATRAEHAGLLTQLSLLIRRHQREFAIGFAAWLIITALAVWFVINLRASERRATGNADLAQRNERQAERNERRAEQNAELATGNERQAERNAELATRNERTAAQNAQLAARNATKALQETEAARHALARAQVALADSAFRELDLVAMAQALDACPADLRDQGWHYLDAKRDSSLRPLKIHGWDNVTTVLAVPGKPGQFVLGGRPAAVAIVDVANDRVVRNIASGFDGEKLFSFSGDGRVLAVTAAGQSSVTLFDARSGDVLKKLNLPGASLGRPALNPDGSLLAVGPAIHGQNPGPTYLLDTRNGGTVWSFANRVHHVMFNKDGSRVMVSSGSAPRQFTLLRTADGVETGHFDANVACQALSPSGKEVALGTPTGEVFLLDAATGALLRQGRLHTGAIRALAWTSDGELITSGDDGKYGEGRWILRLCEATYLTPMTTFFGLKSGGPTPWSLNPQSGDLLTAGNPPRLWRIPAGRERVKLTHASAQAWSACFLSETVLLGRKGVGLARYDLATPGQAVELPSKLLGNNRYSLCAIHRPSGVFAVANHSGNPPHEIEILAGDKGDLVEKLKLSMDALPVDLNFDAAGERLAVVLINGHLQIFDMKSGKTLVNVPGKFERASFAGAAGHLVAISPGTRRADAIEDRLVQIDATNGKELRAVNHRFRLDALAVSPDRKQLALAGADQTVHLFDADTLLETTSFRAHDGEITALAFHPTAPIIATAAMDHSLKLWDYTSARLVDQFLGLGGAPVVLSFNPSGTLLVVDGQEHATRVFDVGGNDRSR